MMQTGTKTLRPCTPMFFSPVVLPFNYDPEADCPKWLDFLSFNLECDTKRIELLQEWFGYCLLPGTKFQKFLMLYGEGGTGKSTALAVLRALLGDSNVSSVPLEQFDSRFSLIQTLGKLANVISDTAEIDKAAEGHLKSFTSGDKMQFEQKGKPVFSEIPSAKLVLATNNLPRFTDRSAGIWRRISLIPFDAKVEESQKVRGMDSPQWWLESGEMSGVFNWALEGLIRLEERGTFTTSEKCDEIIEDYRIQSNPAMAFLNEQYSEFANGFVPTKHMYKFYTEWCEENGYRRLGSGQFGKEVVRAFPSARPARRSVDDVRQTGYDGICRASIYNDSFEVSGVSG